MWALKAMALGEARGERFEEIRISYIRFSGSMPNSTEGKFVTASRAAGIQTERTAHKADASAPEGSIARECLGIAATVDFRLLDKWRRRYLRPKLGGKVIRRDHRHQRLQRQLVRI